MTALRPVGPATSPERGTAEVLTAAWSGRLPNSSTPPDPLVRRYNRTVQLVL